jgi:anaerobic ribonucleoside-triphosphate reductase
MNKLSAHNHEPNCFFPKLIINLKKKKRNYNWKLTVCETQLIQTKTFFYLSNSLIYFLDQKKTTLKQTNLSNVWKKQKGEKVSTLTIPYLILLQQVMTSVRSLNSRFFFCTNLKTNNLGGKERFGGGQKQTNKRRVKKRIIFNSEVRTP